MKNLCIRCNGTGKYLGIGMIKVDCNLCNEKEQMLPPAIDKLDRKSESYKKAVKEIMVVSKVKRKEAVKMFDEAYVRG